MEEEIMTTKEVAEYLRLAEATVYKLARDGNIPAMKLGRAWRFKRDLIDEWFRYETMQNSIEAEDLTSGLGTDQ